MIKTAATLLLIYILYCGFLFLMQRQMMYPRWLVSTPADAKPPAGGERIWLEVGYGKVEAWFLPPTTEALQPPYPVVIFGHGNGEVIDFWPDPFREFNRMGMGLLLVEYPGYGRSDGGPSQKRITDVFTAAYDAVAKRPEVDENRVVLFGRSLGGGAICQLAVRRPSAAMILMSTFTSARSFAIRYLAPGFLMRDPFDNLPVVETYRNPILIIHGTHDEVVPYRHGQKLHAAAPDSKLITYNSGHNDCPPDWGTFWNDVRGFLAEKGILRYNKEDNKETHRGEETP